MKATKPNTDEWLTLAQLGKLWKRSEAHSKLAIKTLIEHGKAEVKLDGKKAYYRFK